MPVDIVVPNLGLTVTEAVLVEWHRQVGEIVRAGEPLLTIETDKAAQEVEAPVSGTLTAILAEAGATVPLGQVVAQIGEAAEARARHAATPRARRIAREHGIDLARVTPADGRRIRACDVVPPSRSCPDEAEKGERGTPGESARFRRLTAQRTAESFRDIPHIYLERQVRADRLLAVRAEIVAEAETRHGVRITLTDFLLCAYARALAQTPALNARWEDGQPIPQRSVDLGLAIETPQGLAAPVLRGGERLSLVEWAQARAALVERARTDRLRPDELSGGSATLSNLGARGVDRFQAILVPGQASILAVGALQPRPFVVDNQLLACPTLFLTLSVDHRIADGADAAGLLERLADRLEKPASLCLP